MAPQINDFFTKLKKTESNHSKLTRIKDSKLILKNSLNVNTEEVIYGLVHPVKFNQETKTEEKAETNRRQTVDKPETNWRQTGDNLINKPETNQRQTGDRIEDKKETRDKVESKPETQLETKWRQSRDIYTSIIDNNKNSKKIPFPFTSLIGIQKKLTLSIYEICKQARDIITPPLTLEFLSNHCKNNMLSIKKSLQRLEIKYIVFRKEFKNGRGGWSRYSLNEITVQEILQHELSSPFNLHKETNRRQTGDKLESKVESEVETNISSSSSYIYNKTTTTELKDELDTEWKYINYSPLAEYGFTENHIRQLSNRGVCDPKIVQDSIYHFAFDLVHNNKAAVIKKDSVSYIMGILLRGEVYAPHKDYRSPQEEDLKNYQEAKAREEKTKNELTQKIQESEFQAWHENLADEDLNHILKDELEYLKSPHMPSSVKAERKMKKLKSYFYEIIWPEIKRKTLGQN